MKELLAGASEPHAEALMMEAPLPPPTNMKKRLAGRSCPAIFDL